ncbi:MAG: hypothetical protein Q4G54_03425 [Pelistega sp.]|nr:hypothetical protein [Pelistega sp.]
MPELSQQYEPQYMIKASAQLNKKVQSTRSAQTTRKAESVKKTQSALMSMGKHQTLYRSLGMGLLLSLSACSSSTLYERTDIHYIQACGDKQLSCAQVQADFTQRCTREHRGQVVLLDDLRPNRLHLVCRPAPEEKPSTGTPTPKPDTPNMQQALQQSSPQGQEQAVSADSPDAPGANSDDN